ncbi:MAG TPA: M57 family metalloprotease [Saprospiraceae bacterium]|nr:M57 family metalloprotease [Saprospiraceae bacterium]
MLNLNSTKISRLKILKGFLILSVLLVFGCKDKLIVNDALTKTFTVDNDKEITISSPDTINSENLEAIQDNLENYFETSKNFNIDTFSVLSKSSLEKVDLARTLQRRLLLELPKYSITSIEGGIKVTRTYYIIEGDINVDKEELYYYSLKRIQKPNDSNVGSGNLTLGTDLSGNPAKWPSGTTIKYTIMRNSFEPKSNYDLVVKEMINATNDWMKVCNIKFEHVPEHDNTEFDLESNSEDIIFIVRQLNVNADFIAKAFFPIDPIYNRNLLLNPSFFVTDYNKTGILRHELGHILGFRHEHIWSKESSCPGENIIQEGLGAIQYSEYDPYSVMHYPCGINRNNKELELTEFDKQAARRIYPF